MTNKSTSTSYRLFMCSACQLIFDFKNISKLYTVKNIVALYSLEEMWGQPCTKQNLNQSRLVHYFKSNRYPWFLQISYFSYPENLPEITFDTILLPMG